MDKFWGVVGGIVLLALTLIVMEASDEVFVRDLEVECVSDRDEYNHVRLDGRTLKFEGAFQENQRTNQLDYSFAKRGDQVTLRIQSEETTRPNFVDTCRRVKVYSLEKDVEPGLYDVEVFHENEKVSNQRIRVL